MRIPVATYRLQFRPEFPFAAARRIVPYLSELGVDTLYASPIFKARAGSSHGYDVADMNALNPELGTAEDFTRLTETVREHGLGWLQDIVPNHMAFDAQNPLLVDLLENAESSRYFRFFDIDWDHFYEGLIGRVLTPFLGRFYGEALEAGEIRLNYNGDGFFASYYDLRFPLRIESYLEVLTPLLGPLRRQLGADHPDHVRFMGVLYLVKTLTGGPPSRERYDQIKFIKQTLWSLYRENDALRSQLDRTLEEFNGRPGEPASFNQLDHLLAQQNFRLAYWKVATEEINYRRFFSINDLISLRMEEKEVFDHCHGLILKMVRQGIFSGLRIDHIDGLYDPLTYLERLNAAAPGTYVVVEKILELKEPLPASWPVAGTSGYEFLNVVNDLFCQRRNERRLTGIYHRFAGPRGRCEEQTYDKKRLIIERHMMGDVDNLANLLKNFASHYRYGSDLTRYSLRRALIEVMAEFPVYRTYITRQRRSDQGRRYLRTALRRAARNNPGLANELEFLQRILPLEMDRNLPEEEKAQWTHFVMRFQQYTGPLMAKGFEDTLLYAYNRLISLNEVGGSPDHFGIDAETFHRYNQSRQRSWPHAMSATATHDTKRGEDVRARINVLSELPAAWEENLSAWSRINRPVKKRVRRRMAPDKNDEYFLYQTLLGSYPFGDVDLEDYRLRIRDYVIKAVREAKIHTAWLKPDNDYEEAYLHFVDTLLSDPDNEFLKAFRPFQEQVAHLGIFNSLAQTLLKLTTPGVPDFYQGTELWELSLVDPDNRRPVDYDLRAGILEEMQVRSRDNLPRLLTELREQPFDGRIKFFVIWRVLQARKAAAELFAEGTYRPLETGGEHGGRVLAFAREREGEWAISVVPRFLGEVLETGEWPLGEAFWKDTHVLLPEGAPQQFQEMISGEELGTGEGRITAGRIFSRLPVGLLRASVGP